jgi:hypothetical protein
MVLRTSIPPPLSPFRKWWRILLLRNNITYKNSMHIKVLQNLVFPIIVSLPKRVKSRKRNDRETLHDSEITTDPETKLLRRWSKMSHQNVYAVYEDTKNWRAGFFLSTKEEHRLFFLSVFYFEIHNRFISNITGAYSHAATNCICALDKNDYTSNNVWLL